MADAEFRYADLLLAGADDTPYRLDLVAQGAQDPAVRLRVRLLVAGFGGIEDAEDALPEPVRRLGTKPDYPKGRATRLCKDLYTDFRERPFHALR